MGSILDKEELVSFLAENTHPNASPEDTKPATHIIGDNNCIVHSHSGRAIWRAIAFVAIVIAACELIYILASECNSP